MLVVVSIVVVVVVVVSASSQVIREWHVQANFSKDEHLVFDEVEFLLKDLLLEYIDYLALNFLQGTLPQIIISYNNVIIKNYHTPARI